MIEDDELNESCIKYLKRQNIPVFSNIEDMKNYESSLREKLENSVLC